MAELKESGKYDIILLDSPPILGLADTTLSENLDGLILVVSIGSVDRSFKETLNKLTNRTNLLGIVTNSVKNQYAIQYSNYWRYKGYQNYNGYNPYQTYASYVENKETKSKDSINENENSKGKFSIISKKLTQKTPSFFKWLDS